MSQADPDPNPTPDPTPDPSPPPKHTNPQYPKRGSDGLLIEDPIPDPDPDPNPDPNPDPDPDPNVIPDDVRERVLAELRTDVPATPDGYEMPTFEGFDAEEAAKSPVFATLREVAHEAGMKPDAFKAAVQKYVEAEQAEMKTFREGQMALLGKDEAARTARIQSVNAALTRTLPKAQAEGLMMAATSAAAVEAIEALLANRPVTTTQAPPEPVDDWPTIQSLMNSKEYMGYEHERDPKIVARVEAYFAKGGKRG